MDAPLATADLVGRLCRWIDRLWPDPDRGTRVAADLRAAFDGDIRPVDAEVCAAVQAVANRHSRHLELAFEAGADAAEDRPEDDPPGWPPPDPRAVGSRAGFVRAAERRPDGVAVLRLDGLDAVELSAPYLDAAFALVRGAPALVLDLRRNGGGDPGALALVLDHLAGGPPRKVSDVAYRDRARQWWTPGHAGTAAVPAWRAAVLTSARIYSSGEALAYHAQHLLNVVVVGETTRGAADHITPVRVARQVVAYLPEAYVVDATTGTNWEGRGVVPDLACAAAEAEDTAVWHLLG
jgi:hypothetical protein